MAADRLLILADGGSRGRGRSAVSAALRDTIGVAARERGRVEVWFVRSRALRRRLEASFPHLRLQEQIDRAMGSRLSDAFARSFADGAERVVLLLRPVPALADATLTSAFQDLHEVDAVLGPTAGGGCYLIGLREEAWLVAPDLFRDVEWWTGSTWEMVLRSAADAGLSPRVLPGLPA